MQVTPVTLLAHLDPRELEVLARCLPEAQAERAERYLDSLTERQQRELAGIRDRLSILAESDVGAWLDPGEGRPDFRPAAGDPRASGRLLPP